tara:strand:+ start:7298 stop:8248 length:951 start_codon:yes stop_codon:yes gene_type:complete
MLNKFFKAKHRFPIWNHNWQPVKYNFVKDNLSVSDLSETGFKIIKSDKIDFDLLTKIFTNNHNMLNHDGGMFYSVYSDNLEYRARVHEKLGECLSPLFENLFKDYKVVLNSFVIKNKGEGSEFKIHQDSTGLNEWEYSPLNVWIPLSDVDETNGCLHLIPSSHKWASPYRGISILPNYQNVVTDLLPYFKPIRLKKGEILLFDNRIIHTSSANNSDFDRVVSMSGVFPTQAKLYSCHKEEDKAKIEIYLQDDDFLIKNKQFYNNCHTRPSLGKMVKKINQPSFNINHSQIQKLTAELKKYPNSITDNHTNFITEPF